MDGGDAGVSRNLLNQSNFRPPYFLQHFSCGYQLECVCAADLMRLMGV